MGSWFKAHAILGLMFVAVIVEWFWLVSVLWVPDLLRAASFICSSPLLP
jgi:hypothetical protein